MAKSNNLDREERLYSVTLGRVTLISKQPIHYKQVDGTAVLIDIDAMPAVKKLLEAKAGVDVAQELGLSTKKLSRLRKGLGLPMRPQGRHGEGTSRTSLWRMGKAAEAEDGKE